MLDRLHRLALLLAPFKPLVLLGVVGCGLLLAGVVLGYFGDDRLLAPGLVGLLWFLGLAALITNFSSGPPAQPPAGGSVARLGHRLTRAWYWLLAVAFIAVTLAALYLSLRITMVLLQE